ncbi:MAG: hypothetical protein R3Y28_02695 [Candidatus Gastranaerophilales bacterium]
MKKIILTMMMMFMFVGASFADCLEEATAFFNSYVEYANSYNSAVADMYSPDAKIIRQVVLPSGGTVDVTTDVATYLKQMKLSLAVARLKKYSNTYTEITYTELSDCQYKVEMLRQPSGETYQLDAYMILTKQDDGTWLITEEMMQTREQVFLKYAD